MLGEYLDDHNLSSLLKKERKIFPCMEERERWEAVPEAIRNEILRMAGEYREKEYPMCLATQFLRFVRDGSRKAYEEPYFLRRRKLIVSFLHCCITGSNAELDHVIDGIWCICEETSWVVSAHNGSDHPGQLPAAKRPLPDVNNPFVDLFSAQTAMILSIVCSVAEKQLNDVSPLIVRRAWMEIEKRVILPFEKRDDFWWMGFIRKDLCNWTPWIVSNVMLTGAVWIRDDLRLAELLERGARMIDRYLAIMPDDGGCDEGAGYWNMAGGSLLDALELLETLTDGKMTFWKDEKLRGILTFPRKAELGGGWYVNFADCDAKPKLSGERLITAGEKTEDCALAALGERCETTVEQLIGDVPHLWRVMQMMFHEKKEIPPEEKKLRDVFLPDLQLRVLEKNGSTLVCKGGSNGESHNHNDVGSFMLYIDGEPEIIDAGNMIYTAKTFSTERYTLWNVRSVYHNVPVIGGHEQLPGKEHCAENCETYADGMTLRMEKAYGEEAGIEKYVRSFLLSDDGRLTVHDLLSLKREEKTEFVFMLRHEPVFLPGSVRAGKLKIRYSEKFKAVCEEIDVTDKRMAKSFPGSIYRLILRADNTAEYDETFVFEADRVL